MKIQAIDKDHPLWDETIIFAENCSWYAGKRLASRMRENDFSGWERVITVSDNGNIVGFCVFEARGFIPKNFDCSPFINFVFVDERYRGQRISEKLIRFALDYAEGLGFKRVYLKSEHHGLYEKYGFVKICSFVPVIGRANQLFVIGI